MEHHWFSPIMTHFFKILSFQPLNNKTQSSILKNPEFKSLSLWLLKTPKFKFSKIRNWISYLKKISKKAWIFWICKRPIMRKISKLITRFWLCSSKLSKSKGVQNNFWKLILMAWIWKRSSRASSHLKT